VSAARIHVLVVDDSEPFALPLSELLEREGFDVLAVASNGVEAVEHARRLRPDVVTMDLDMPVMDGVEATAHIVDLGIPVVVVTAVEYGERVAEAIAAGAVAYIHKAQAGVSLPELLRRVATPRRTRMLQCQECPTTSTDTHSDGWLALLSDDDPPVLVAYCPSCAAREFGR
jgi:CheY-like chemotaxis protein